jgi:hypothetical protein
MIHILPLFIGMLVGFLIVSVFYPPIRDDKDLPTPGDKSRYYTGTGCVKFVSKEVPCSKNTTSLNFIASQNK